MKGLFVIHTSSDSLQNTFYKQRPSKEILQRRYAELFFRNNVFQDYCWLSFLSNKFELPIDVLLEMFLENLYDEEKVSFG